MAALLIAGCGRPLRPGETRCTSKPGAFGTTDTDCETGQAEKAVGYWCTQRPDGFGPCVREPARCENWRFEQNRGAVAARVYGACFWQATSICASTCYVNPASCVTIERDSGRDSNACVVTE